MGGDNMRNRITLVSVFFIFPLICFSNLVHAASSVEIDAKVDAALKDFYSKVGGGKELAEKAHGVLVFPSVIKAGLVIGGEYGEGALQMDGKTADYYSVAGAVALATLGAGGSIDTKTLQQPIIGFVFSNKGLMVDVSLKGSKMTKIKR